MMETATTLCVKEIRSYWQVTCKKKIEVRLETFIQAISICRTLTATWLRPNSSQLQAL